MPPVSAHTCRAQPKVSVAMVTYNHERFISQAIDSALMQETDFPVEIVIGEDVSTDGTRTIVREYAEKYPDIIRTLLPGQNLGMRENLNRVLSSCRGEYIALLEGDDYWIAPEKLQRQVEVLETNRSYALSFTNVMVVYDRPGMKSHPGYGDCDVPAHGGCLQIIRRRAERTTKYDLARGNYIHTPGVVFRNWLLQERIPDYMREVSISDWPLHMFTVLHGDVWYSHEIMVGYRVHTGGFWSMQSTMRRLYLTLMQYPAMLSSDVFEDSIKDIWRQQLPGLFLDFYRLAMERDSVDTAVEVAAALSRSWESFACGLAKEHFQDRQQWPACGFYRRTLSLLGWLRWKFADRRT